MIPRLFLLTFTVFCLEMGVFLVALPWSASWETNYFLYRYPALAPFLLNYAVRGVITGLGLVDIAVALWYALHFDSILTRWTQAAEAPAPPRARESLSRGRPA